MNNFQLSEKVHARYSEQEEAWWKMPKDYVHEPPSEAFRQPPGTHEVTAKVTSIRHPVAEVVEPERPPSDKGERLARNFDEGEDKTLHRWTTEFVPNKGNHIVPRYFDGVTQAGTFSMDTAELDQFSSFECIAKGSVLKNQKRQQKVAKKDEERAHAWKLSIRGVPDHSDTSVDSPSQAGFGAMDSITSRGPPSDGTLPLSARGPSTGLRNPAVPRFPARAQKSELPLAEALGEDAPMTARLNQMLTGRYKGNQTSPAGMAAIDQNATQPTPIGGERTPRDANKTKPSPGGAATASPGAMSARKAADPQGLVVRTGGFQYIQRIQNENMQSVSLGEDASNSSLLRTPQAAPKAPSRSGSMQNRASPV